MSCDVVKIGLIGEVVELYGQSLTRIEHYFNIRGISSDEIDYNDNKEIESLYYDSAENALTVRCIGEHVYVGYTLIHDVDNFNLFIDFNNLVGIENTLINRFNATDIKLFGYQWYSGIDEPYFDEK